MVTMVDISSRLNEQLNHFHLSAASFNLQNTLAANYALLFHLNYFAIYLTQHCHTAKPNPNLNCNQ